MFGKYEKVDENVVRQIAQQFGQGAEVTKPRSDNNC